MDMNYKNKKENNKTNQLRVTQLWSKMFSWQRVKGKQMQLKYGKIPKSNLG